MMVDKKKDAVDQKVEAEVANILAQELTQPYHSPVAPAKDIYAEAAKTMAPVPDTLATFKVKGYEHLERILTLAYEQAAKGKGVERHGSNRPVGNLPWDQQPILANARQVGPGGPAMQVMKKVGEGVTMTGNGNFSGAKAEALGAIVYAAALYKLYEEMEAASRVY